MSAAFCLLPAGFLLFFLSSGIRTSLPELILRSGRDTSERRQAALDHLGTIWLIRLIGILASGAGIVPYSLDLASSLSIPVWYPAAALALIIFLLGEILPSRMARTNPEKFLKVFGIPYRFLAFLFRRPALLILGKPASDGSEYEDWLITPPDVIWLERRREKGDPGEYEKEQELMDSIIDYSDKIVREVMVPRIDMVCIEMRADFSSVVNQVLQAGHSRIPVYDERIDSIEGVLYAKDLLAYLSRDEEGFVLRKILRTAYFVPEYKRIDELLREFQANRIHVAIVVDEYGGTAGLVTLEDIVEEVFGEILDEYDEESLLIKTLGKGSFLLDARLPIDELNELLDTSFEDVDYESLGGMVYQVMGKIPRQGESITIGEFRFCVEKIKAQRILFVRIEPYSPSKE